MYASGHAASRYAAASNATAAPKSVEYRAFSHANSLMKAASEHDGPDRIVRLAEAIHYNTRLWTILAADVANDSNTLPDALRAGIISLTVYVQKASHGVLREEIAVGALVEINTMIMRGLRGESG